MKNYFFLLLLLPGFAFCQLKQVSIGVIGAPIFYSLLEPNYSSITYNKKYNYKVGIDANLNFGKFCNFNTGIFYTAFKYNTNYNYKFIDPNDPFIPRMSENSSGYISMPLVYHFIFINSKKLNIYTNTGLIATILLHSKGSTTYEDNSTRENKGIQRKILAGFQASIGLQYLLSERIGINLEPQIILYNRSFDSFSYSRNRIANINLGVSYNLFPTSKTNK